MTIRGVQEKDYGTYRCIAENDLGSKSMEVKFGKPGKIFQSIKSSMVLWNLYSRATRTADRHQNLEQNSRFIDVGLASWLQWRIGTKVCDSISNGR